MANQYFCEQHQTARASSALPAAGAFDASPVEMPVVGFQFGTLYISYTRAAAGGDMRFRVEVNPDAIGGSWASGSIYAGGAVASGSDSLSDLQREVIEYGSTGAGAEVFVYGPFEIRGGAERMRVVCAESGAIPTPGTVSIKARFWE